MEGNPRTIWQIVFLYSPATSWRNYKEKITVNFLNISSAIRPVPHTEDLPVPVPPQQYNLDSGEDRTENQGKIYQPPTSTDADFTAGLQCNEFHRITPEDLNDLIRDLDLPKNKTELLGSRVQQWNLLKENVRISVYHRRQ